MSTDYIHIIYVLYTYNIHNKGLNRFSVWPEQNISWGQLAGGNR